MTTKAQQAEQEAAREFLRARIRPGDTLYTILRHVSRSGMRRHISVIQLGAYGEHPADWSGKVAAALGRRRNRDDGGVIVNGTGMDMGFELVYSLGRTLYPGGYACIGERCVSNDHVNRPHPPRVAESMQHQDGGYAFEHRWL